MSITESGQFKKLRALAPAKINLHLEVLGLRQDGFHELAMLMQSIDLFDEIDFLKTNNAKINLTSNDPTLSIGEDNLIVRAAKLMIGFAEDKQLGAQIHLKKNIPIGAGLAGGSSDAAATVIGLNQLWELGLSIEEMEGIAAELGSDVPFCLEGGTQLCFGRGESLEPVNIDDLAAQMAIVLVKDPKVEVSTPWAYRHYKERKYRSYLKLEKDFQAKRQLLREAGWLNPLTPLSPPPLRNDLQEVIEPAIPAVKNALDFLSSLEGVLSIAMSGSGPSCFAIFPNFNSAQMALNNNKKRLELSGLKAWSCSFRTKGVDVNL